MNSVINQMKHRIKNKCDPITGEKMETKGPIKWAFDKNGKDLHKLVDSTDREVKLNSNKTWVYS